jgi:UDP-N-acetylmuramoyl-L-alanyl-D-glutamate--2,6-diaminopimelate ligase
MIPLEQNAVSSPGLSLGELESVLSSLSPSLEGSRALVVTGVRHDSREVRPGDLFVARRGDKSDGAAHATEAISRGAVALIAERDARVPSVDVPVIRVSDARRALALSAECVYGSPSRALSVVGITGTNGKTTTAVLVADALGRLGARAATLGTLGFSFEGVTREGSHTTPEADEISRILSLVRERGGTHLVMEVSSHALSQERVAALHFEVAAFTNLSQDHLDFHGTMERYGAEKARLFSELLPRRSVINVDDAFGRELAAQAVRGELITVAQRAGDEADIRVERAEISASGILASLSLQGRFATDGRKGHGSLELRSRLIGEHNLDNLLVALGILLALDFPAELAAGALGLASAAPGRLERCDGPGDELTVVVDYAHTPDALSRVLRALRSSTAAKLWCVFGCGGDRDPGKRPKMGKAVAELSDVAVVTNDNPRGEAPEKIVEAILPPLRESGIEHRVVLDRALAIERTVLEAAPGDCILIAGKGHENYQIFASGRTSFDDRVEARRALALRRKRSELLAGKGGQA